MVSGVGGYWRLRLIAFDMPNKLILTAIGSLGDLHPIIALALAAKKTGFDPLLAIPESYLETVRAAGLAAAPIMPDFEVIRAKLGMSSNEIAKAVLHDTDFTIRKILFDNLAANIESLDNIAGDAVAIVGANFTVPGPIVAQKRGIPFVPVILSPMLTLSPLDPPSGPGFGMLMQPPLGSIGVAWNRIWLTVICAEMRRRYSGTIDAVRILHGLPPAQTTPIFGADGNIPLRLGLYSPVMGEIQPDYPAKLELTGFAAFDSLSGYPEVLDDEFEAFLTNGPAPLVFTLGSFAPHAGGNFYHDSLLVARALKMRAVLLTGDNDIPSSPDIMVRKYAPHSLIFPRAAVIVHHGGVGTTGQALKAGRSQLVVPMNADQFDNGKRIKRAGVGDVLAAKKYTSAAAICRVSSLVSDSVTSEMAVAIGARVNAEGGAKAAAEALARVLLSA